MRLNVSDLPEPLRELFEFAKEFQATDIYVKENSIPFFSIAGVSGKPPFFLQGREEGWKFVKQRLTKAVIMDFLDALQLDPSQKELRKEKDFSVELHDNGKVIGRFRVNLSLSNGRITLCFRRLFSLIPSIDDLLLPQVLKEVRNYSTGLVLITGPTGSGKSTTTASLIDYLLEDPEKSRVVITIEKPIEYVFEDKHGYVLQREVGKDTESFVSGVHNALRQKPDVLFVGEARSREEIKAVLNACETGHLTLTTLHTSSAVSTIARMVDVFPAEEQPAILTALANELRLVISQRLVVCLDGRVRAVCEVLKVSERIRNLIKQKELRKIREYLERKEDPDCQTLDDELYKLCKVEGIISEEVAIRTSLNPQKMKERLSGVVR